MPMSPPTPTPGTDRVFGHVFPVSLSSPAAPPAGSTFLTELNAVPDVAPLGFFARDKDEELEDDGYFDDEDDDEFEDEDDLFDDEDEEGDDFFDDDENDNEDEVFDDFDDED